MSPRKHKLTSMSLFSGCGGLDLGLTQAGFDVLLANDNDAHCVASYDLNFGAGRILHGSVTQIDESVINDRLGSKLAKGRHIDLLAGGPPCPPYSKSRFYRKNKPRALADPIGEETLRGYLHTLDILRPRAFLFENVFGFAYRVHKDAFNCLLSTAESLGYQCSSAVLNAADYGVPQIRQRFFMVGMLGHKFKFPPPTHRDPGKAELNGVSLPSWTTAGEAIGDLDTLEKADDKGHFAGGKHNDILKLIPPGDNYLFFTKERGYAKPLFKWRSRYWSFLLKLSPTMPSWTIQARRSNNMGPLHWRNRMLRIEEVKRLQGFPDDWKLTGTIEKQWRQIGNAVPPPLAKVIGTAIRAQLESCGATS